MKGGSNEAHQGMRFFLVVNTLTYLYINIAFSSNIVSFLACGECDVWMSKRVMEILLNLFISMYIITNYNIEQKEHTLSPQPTFCSLVGKFLELATVVVQERSVQKKTRNELCAEVRRTHPHSRHSGYRRCHYRCRYRCYRLSELKGADLLTWLV